MSRIVLTGASGFVGQAVLQRLLAEGRNTTGWVRGTPGPHCVQAGDLCAEQDFRRALREGDTLIHAAARVHVMRDAATDPLAEFRRVNTAATLALARQAAGCGARRFIFISSIKVNGEATAPGQAFSADDAPAPVDAYGISKREAEDGLRALGQHSAMEVTIVRPPLVYGPGVGANFAALMRLLARGLPLPLGAVTDNRRSLVALDNLVDLLVCCIDHPAAANRTFLASDGEDLSTTGLLHRLARAMDRPARLLPIAPAVLERVARLLGRADLAGRLLGSLQVDIGATRRTLGWAPPIDVDEGLRRTVAALRATQR